MMVFENFTKKDKITMTILFSMLMLSSFTTSSFPKNILEFIAIVIFSGGFSFAFTIASSGPCIIE